MSNGTQIKLHITSSQSDSQGTVDSMEFYTEGRYYEKQGNKLQDAFQAGLRDNKHI